MRIQIIRITINVLFQTPIQIPPLKIFIYLSLFFQYYYTHFLLINQFPLIFFILFDLPKLEVNPFFGLCYIIMTCPKHIFCNIRVTFPASEYIGCIFLPNTFLIIGITGHDLHQIQFNHFQSSLVTQINAAIIKTINFYIYLSAHHLLYSITP